MVHIYLVQVAPEPPPENPLKIRVGLCRLAQTHESISGPTHEAPVVKIPINTVRRVIILSIPHGRYILEGSIDIDRPKMRGSFSRATPEISTESRTLI